MATLELTEQARALGFDTVEAVLDAGQVIADIFGGTPESVAVEDGMLWDADASLEPLSYLDNLAGC